MTPDLPAPAAVWRCRWLRPGWAPDSPPRSKLYAGRVSAEAKAQRLRSTGAAAWVERAQLGPWVVQRPRPTTGTTIEGAELPGGGTPSPPRSVTGEIARDARYGLERWEVRDAHGP